MSLKYYTHPIEVYNKLVKVWKNTPVNQYDVFEQCMDVEINHIGDADLQSHFTEWELIVDKTTGLAAMPCNVFRVIEVYDSKNNDVPYQITGSNHVKVTNTTDQIYMNFNGATVDEEGIPVIHQGHVNAMVTFCLMRLVEEQVLLQKMPMGFLKKYEQQFAGQITHIKQSAQYKDRKHYDNVNIIRTNMIKKVGQKRLMKTMFG